MNVHRCKVTYWTSPAGCQLVTYEALVDGVKYRCDDRELDLLYQGVDPADLDLVEITDSDEDTEAGERFLARRWL